MATVAERPAITMVDGSKIKATPSAHRNLALSSAEFQYPGDARVTRVSFGTYNRESHSSPRHRHTFDQIRFIVAGQVKYGPLRCQAGDCVYFPEGVFYGPQELISDRLTNCTIQTQGPSWTPYPGRAEREAAVAALRESGEFDRQAGSFHWRDGRVQDSFEAIFEKVTDRPIEYPDPRFHSPVLLRSEHFDWILERHDGVSVKPLAIFNAGGPAVRLVRLEPGSSLPAEELSSHQLVVVLEGAVRYEDRRGEQATYFFCPAGSTFAAVDSSAGATLLFVQLQVKGAALEDAWRSEW